ncbi:MAG: hypothetical protein GY847_38465 [Proteobacteria bacterium]|nr:hypothetical protein [Pseudomonadota bacterium]
MAKTTKRKTKKAIAAPKPKRSSVVSRKDGRELRRMTVYLPVDLARKLAVHCAANDLEMSGVMAAAVAEYLE